MEKMAALQQQIIDRERPGVLSERALAARIVEPAGDIRDDALHHFVLDGEDVFHRPVVALVPQVLPAFRFDQLDGHAHALARAANAALDDEMHAELAPHRPQGCRALL